MRRRDSKSVVKAFRLTGELPWKLLSLSLVEETGMCGVAVKCVDIAQNADCEGRSLG